MYNVDYFKKYVLNKELKIDKDDFLRILLSITGGENMTVLEIIKELYGESKITGNKNCSDIIHCYVLNNIK